MASAAPKQRTSTPVRSRVLKVATGLFVRKGPDALTVRDVATAAGCSTMMIYTWFGGKDELIAAIYFDGFRRLEASLATCAAESDPIERLRALAHAYRTFAFANPVLYAAMFSRPMAPEHVQGRRSHMESASFTTLLDAVRSAIDAGAFDATYGAAPVADAFWAAVHGYVSLEVTGHFSGGPDASALRFSILAEACLDGLAATSRAPSVQAPKPKPKRRR